MSVTVDEKWWKIVTSSTQSRLVINTNLMVEFIKPMPCWWHRFWYKVLLGWRWESLGEKEKRKSVKIPRWLRALFFFAVGFLLTQFAIMLLCW